jgi:TatD DNase family protein
MEFIDSHAHIYLSEFDEDRTEILERASHGGVKKIFLPAIDSSTHNAMLQVTANYPNCIPMMGLHPCSVKEDYENELIVVSDYLKQRKFVAIGEIGLDFYWDKTFTHQQYDAFHKQIQLAQYYQLPIVIHSRNATDECIDVVKQYPGINGIFHCFSGNLQQAQQLIDLGFLLGIGGVVTFKNAGLDKVIEHLSADNLVLETDAPYLAPVPYRGKRNESSYLPLIAEKVAGLLNQPLNEVAAITTNNAIKLFGLP